MTENTDMIVDKVNLECGTSLAELEFTSETDVRQRQKEELKNKSNSALSSNVGDDQLQSQSLTTEENINLIRLSLANDVVTNNGITMFTSPFETPEARNSTGQTNIPESERYVSVPLIYCDQTASNRPLKSIEKFINDRCLPLYGNTHTNTSVSGSQSTAFVAEARQIVAEGVNAKISGKAALDVVLFAGNGATSAVELLVDCLGIKNLCGSTDKRPAVFVGPYEHHSNLIPWRESGCEIVMIPECVESQNVDLKYLEGVLQHPKFANRVKMGTFTAASNVTGKVCDVNEISAILHKYKTLAFFDYATGAPYLSMDMNPPPTGQCSAADVSKDAIFLSPHKMIGGINTPGILILKKSLINQTNAPGRSGGGTVFYVTHTHHRFLSNRIERYEGGTPNVVGIMRVGLTFLVKRKMETELLKSLDKSSNNDKTPHSVLEYDLQTHDDVVKRLSQTAPNVILLGKRKDGRDNKNIPIFSFLVKCGERFLHYNYVCAILNDLFGIQSRGGCQCSGPYSQNLLGLTNIVDGKEVPSEANLAIENALLHFKERAELLRPGYTRLSLPFKGLSNEEAEFVLKALEWVAKNGWALMCQYRCNHRTGEWRHFSRQGKPLGRTERKWLSHFDMHEKTKFTIGRNSENLNRVLENTLDNANYQLLVARTEQRYIMQALKMSDDSEILKGDANLEKLRWYVYPKECAQVLKQGLLIVPKTYSNEIAGALRLDGLNQITPIDYATTNDKAHTFTAIEESNNETKFVFRDGDSHSGEGTYTDIAHQYKCGDLSDNCDVLMTNENIWQPIDRFLGKRKKARSSEKSSKGGNNIIQQNLHVDSVREKKKVSRGSNSWGQNLTVLASLTSATKNDLRIGSAKLPAMKAADASNTMKKSTKNRRGNPNHIKPPQKIMKYVTQGIMQFDMIQDGDKLLLGLSGGKDSLTLLHCLLELKRKLPTKFELEVCTIDPMTPSFDPSSLIPYVESLGLKYHYVKDNIVDRANSGGKNGTVVTSLCAYCARMKRGNLYATARNNSCNKLVLAQHLDDCAESCFMSMMHNGFIRTMKSKYEINAGDLTVIRPLCYCRESLMTQFAKENNLPVINENCPACFEEPKERARVKKLLSREETLYPNIYDNIRRSLIPIMHSDMESILRCYTEEAVSKSRKIQGAGKKGRRRNCDDEENKKAPTKVHLPTLIEKEVEKIVENISDEQLLKELTRRKARKFRLAGAMKRKDENEDSQIVGAPKA